MKKSLPKRSEQTDEKKRPGFVAAENPIPKNLNQDAVDDPAQPLTGHIQAQTNKRQAGSAEMQIRNVFMQAPAAIAVIEGPHQKFVLVNALYQKLFGRTEEQLLGKTIREVFPEIQDQNICEILEQVYQSGKAFVAHEYPATFNHAGVVKTGYYDFVAEPIRDEDGAVVSVMIHALEVTWQIEARKKIEESEKNYRELLTLLPVAVYTCDTSGRILFFNDVAVKLWGYKPDILDESIKFCACYKVWTMDGTFVPPDQTPMALALKTGQSFRNVEAIVQRPDGKNFYASVNADPLFDENGNIKGAINIFQDITNIKQAEMAVRESKELYKKLIYGLPVAFYTIDEHGVLTLYNEAAAELWGRHPQIGKDKWCGSWKIFESDGFTEVPLDECPMAISLKEKRKVVADNYFIVERPDGTRRYFIPFAEPMYDADGKLTGAVNTLIDVTESKKAEVANAKLAAIVQFSEDAIVSKTTEGIVTSWNPSAQKLFGYTAEEMIGQSITKIIPPDRINEEVMILSKISRGEVLDHFETKRITKDGRQLDISLTISPIKDSNGKVIGASKIARDITGYTEARKQIEESEKRLRLVIEAAEMGTFDWNMQTDEFIYSKRLAHIFGYSNTDNLTQQNFIDVIHPDDWEIRKKAHEEALATGDLYYEIRVIWKDASMHWIKVEGKVVFENNVAVRMYGTGLDITEQKTYADKLEKEVKERTSELTTLNSSFEKAEVIGKMGTYTWNLVTNKVAWSKNMYEVYGVDAKNFEPVLENILKLIHPDDIEHVRSNIEQGIKTGILHPVNYRIIANGEIKEITGSGRFGANDRGERIMIGLVQDITEEKKNELLIIEANKELAQKNTALEKTNRELEQFARIASHDLQEPLRKIQTFSNMLKGSVDNKEAITSYLEKISTSAGRMQTLIQDVLNYSRTSYLEEKFEAVDLNNIIESAKHDFELLIEEKHAVIKYKDLPTVKGIPLLFSQLFSNLISNALKFSNKNPVIQISSSYATDAEVRQHLQLDPQRKYYHIVFKDNGIGFEEEYAEQIFAIFQRLHGRQDYSGTGIGLALVKKIVENHEGIITATGKPNKGATFDIYLPA